MYDKNFHMMSIYYDSISKNWLRTSFWKQLLGKYTSPELDLDPDLAVTTPDPGSGKKVRIRPDPQHCLGIGVGFQIRTVPRC